MRHHIIYILLLGFVLISCQAPVDVIPEDLDGLKQYVSEKKAKLSSLEKEIEDLEKLIAEQEPEKEKPRKSVTTFGLEPKEFKSFTELQGSIQSSDAVNISSETGGRIISFTINEGDYVTKGQVVGKIDMESLQKQIQEVEKSLELATTVYQRQEKLWDQNIGSEIQYLQAKNNKERLEKSLETISSNLSKANITSPMNGYVDRVYLKGGETTGPGTPIATVINTSTVKALIDVPENMISSVKKGQKVKVILPALGTERNERISMIGRSIDPANRTFKIEINMANRGGLLKPNLLTLVEMTDKTIKEALMVPTELIQQDVSGNTFIYTVAEGEEGPYAQKNIVETGESYDGEILITNGLSIGDKVINTGARGLAEEDLIQISNDTE